MITRFSLIIAFLLSSTPLAFVQSPQTDSAGLALVNGRIWVGDASRFAEAIAIKGNKILAVGTTAEIKQSIGQTIGEGAEVIDLGGRLVTPGFNDAHLHFLSGARGLTEIDLSSARSVAEMIERIALFARQNPRAPWITGRGWQYGGFPGGLPTKSYLDAVVKDRPVFLTAYDQHTGWANSRALELAGITRETKFEGYGEIVRDASNEPTGALKEGAQKLVQARIPEPSRRDQLNAIRFGMLEAARLGITSIQNESGSLDEFSLYEELQKAGELTFRVRMAFSAGATTTPAEIARWVELKNRYDRNPMLSGGAVKILLDGVIESHTAAMIDRYSDLPPNHGSPFGELAIPPDLYRRLVAMMDKAGLQISTHAIGDRAVREALSAYEAALGENQRKDARHRIEHIETLSPADIPRFAAAGVLASMQPIHADPGSAEVWSKAVGPERLPTAFAWASLLKGGASLVFSSDWPASISLDPIRGLHCAVNRRTIEGTPPKGWVPQQRITLAEALRAYTQAGAYASFEESIKGTIAPGMLADLVVLSQDLFKIDPLKIHETRVMLTVFDGKIIHRDIWWDNPRAEAVRFSGK
jgi:predicted amidohydrolase YtcJ